MPRYFMQLRDGTDHLLDPEGIEYADLDELRKKVLIAVRDLISGDAQSGEIDMRFRIDAEDRDGVIVYTLAFKEAVKIIPDDAPKVCCSGLGSADFINSAQRSRVPDITPAYRRGTGA
jgi:hypothetical protein